MNVLSVFVAVVGSTTLLVASQPVATVTSLAPFELQGHQVNVGGVPSWPVAAGDIVATRSESATIQLRQGTRITLLENSTVRIGSSGSGAPTIDLLAGRMRIGSSPSSKLVNIYVDGKSVQASSGSTLSSRTQPHAGSTGTSRSAGSPGNRVPLLPTPVSSQ
jgi:hypothetical protein